MNEDKATTETPCCRMVGRGNGWGVWEEGRAWLCVGPDVGAAQSVHTAEPRGFTQSMNIYCSYYVPEEALGVHREYADTVFIGRDGIL